MQRVAHGNTPRFFLPNHDFEAAGIGRAGGRWAAQSGHDTNPRSGFGSDTWTSMRRACASAPQAPPARLPLQPTPHHRIKPPTHWPDGVASASHPFAGVIPHGHLQPLSPPRARSRAESGASQCDRACSLDGRSKVRRADGGAHSTTSS